MRYRLHFVFYVIQTASTLLPGGICGKIVPMALPARWLFSAVSLFAHLSALPAHTPEPSLSPSPSPAVVAAAPAPTPHGPQITWSSVRVKEPFIALTFDDGPSASLTPKLLDLLKARNIHVTFFVLGEMVKAHPEILRRALAEGHEVGNHSWDHPQLSRMSDEAVRSQLNRTQEAVQTAIGQKMTLMRPPYGAITAEQKKWVHDDLGYKIILWAVDPLDWKRPGPEIVRQRIVTETRNGSIILSHDIHPGTVEAMPATLDELLGKGFKFVTVSELLAMELPPEPKPTPHPPRVPKPVKPANPLPAGLPDKIDGAPSPAP